MTPDQKQKLLDRVAKEIAETKGGPFGKGLNPVPGEGNPDADVLFIGEGPGFHEDQQRRPFVGVSGQLLRKTMVENGFLPENVFITNIVKFRPPENRDPTPSEIEFFRPFLDKQIEIIDPKIVVTLGRYSMYKFLGADVSISRVHGWSQKIGKFIIFPMFHPAAALRAGDMMKMFLEDFKKLRELIDKKDGSQTEKIRDLKSDSKQLNLI